MEPFFNLLPEKSTGHICFSEVTSHGRYEYFEYGSEVRRSTITANILLRHGNRRTGSLFCSLHEYRQNEATVRKAMKSGASRLQKYG